MSDHSQENGPAPADGGAGPSKKKRTCLVCCCVGCLGAFIITGMLSIIYSGFMIELLRSLIVPK
jgi:hypothetical protein